MSSAEDVQNTNGILALPRFQKCMGRVPSDEKIPDDMSDEGKCTVQLETDGQSDIDISKIAGAGEGRADACHLYLLMNFTD